MKKLISLLLVICLLCPLFVGCVNQDEDYKMKKKYLRQFKIEDKSPEDVIIDYDGGTYNGARIVMLDIEWHDPEEWTETIGDTTIQYYDSNRLYAYKNGKFYTLSDAYEKGKMSKNEITQIALKFSMDVCFYLDTCDIYDFDKSFFVDGDLSKNEMYDKLNVWVDWKALEGIDFTSTTWVEHMTTHLGNNLIETWGITHISDDFMVLYIELAYNTKEHHSYVANELKKVPGILKVDSYSEYGWNNSSYTNSFSGVSWAIESIQVEKVWEFTKGSSVVHVGIMDMGIYNHSLLMNNFIYEYDYSIDSSNYTGDIRHGTFIAGIVGAEDNLTIENIAVNKNVSIVSFLVDNEYYDNRINMESVKMALDDAYLLYYDLRSPLKILNVSLSFDPNTTNIEDKTRNYSGLIVTAAGNDGRNIDIAAYYDYPSYYGSSLHENEAENIISVGALDENGNRWYQGRYQMPGGEYIVGSNYGSNTVDLYAPGVNIISIYPENMDNGSNGTIPNGYHKGNGTSYAAPFVSGVAALLLSIEPNLTISQLKNCLIDGADNITIMVGDNNDISQSAKKLNAWGAFKYLMNNYYTYESNETKSISSSSNVITFTDTIVSTQSYSTFKENTSLIKLTIQNPGDYTFNISASEDFKIKLYDYNFNAIFEESSSNSNTNFLRYLPAGTYYIKTNLADNYAGNGGVEISYSINCAPHVHSYTKWAKYSSTHHIECCEHCGQTGSRIEIHVVIKSEVVNNIGFCKYCGARVMLGSDFGQVEPMFITKVTINGSYILPNGIIVLVDEDIEAYENGTLVWYDKDNLPQTE